MNYAQRFLTIALASSISIAAVAQSGTVIHLQPGDTLSTLNNIINERGNVIIDFHATWCGPCKRMSPTLDSLARDYDSVTFVKVDVDQLPAISSYYSIRSLPTLVYIKNGKQVKKESGCKSKKQLKKNIKKIY